MCDHLNIVVVHNKIPKQCAVRCKDCKETLYQSSTGIDETYDYLELNKSSYKALLDLTGDCLNDKFNIPE
jgi:hypothetical protein